MSVNLATKIALLIVSLLMLSACDEDTGPNPSRTLAELIGLQVVSAPIAGKICQVLPSSTTSLAAFDARRDQVSACAVQGEGSSFTDAAYATPRVEYFGKGMTEGVPDLETDIQDHFQSYCTVERSKYLRMVSPAGQFACWDGPYKDIVNLLTSTENPNSTQRDCANLYDLGASLRHANDWACLNGKVSTYDQGYTPITLDFGINGCAGGQQALPADISGLGNQERVATQAEKELLWYGPKSNSCSSTGAKEVNIFIPDSLGMIGFDFYKNSAGILRPSAAWEGGGFSGDKVVTFRLRQNVSQSQDQQTCNNGYLQYVVNIIPTMKVKIANPTQNSAFCYSGPEGLQFELHTSDIGQTQSDKECYRLQNSSHFLCYPKQVVHSASAQIATRVQVTATALNSQSRCTTLQGNGLPASLVQPVCITETLIKPAENWAVGEPNDPAHDCVAMGDDGKWDDRHCSEIKAFTCQNSQNPDDWKQTQYRGTWEEGFEACNELPGGPYIFEKPDTAISFNTQMARALATPQAAAFDGKTWINYYAVQGQDRWTEGDHFHNLPTPIHTSGSRQCVIVGTDSRWQFVPCDFIYSTGISNLSPVFACRKPYTGDPMSPNVRLTQATGPWQNGFEECRKLDQGQYRFSKPQNSEENGGVALLLGQTQSPYPVAWVNFADNGSLLMVPSAYRNFAGYPANAGRRCAFRTDQGNWQDAACTDIRPYACRDRRNSSHWIVTSVTGPFEQGFRTCADYDNGHFEFAAPRTTTEDAQLAAAIPANAQPWINFHLHQHDFHDEWEPASPFDFPANVVTRSGVAAVLEASGFNAMANRAGNPVNVHFLDVAASAEPHYAFEYAADRSLVGIAITASAEQKLPLQDLHYVLAQALVERLLGTLPDSVACTTSPSRYPRLLSDVFTGQQTSSCLDREMLVQVYLSYLMLGEPAVPELAQRFSSRFPMGPGRRELLATQLAALDFTHGQAGLPPAFIWHYNNDAIRALVSATGSFGILLTSLQERAELTSPVINVIDNSSIASPRATFVRNGSALTQVTIESNDQTARYPAQELWYLFGQIVVDSLLGELPNELKCTLANGQVQFPLRLTDTLNASQSDACLLREAFAQTFIAMAMTDHLQLETLAYQFKDWTPVGHGRNLGLGDFFSVFFRPSPVEFEHEKLFVQPLHMTVSVSEQCDADNTCSKSHVVETLEDEYIAANAECEYFQQEVDESWHSHRSRQACDSSMQVLCQKVQINTNPVTHQDEVNYLEFDGYVADFYGQDALKITSNSYRVRDADIGCVLEHGEHYTGYHGSLTHITLPNNVSDLGTGTIHIAASGTSGGTPTRKRARDDSGVIKGVRESARVRTASGSNGIDRRNYNYLQVHTLNVGTGSCHLVQCIPTDDAGNVDFPKIESAVVDCGSSNYRGYALDRPGAVAAFRAANFYSGRPPVVALSHPDRDHFNFIPDLLNPWNVVSNLYLGGPVRDYLDGPTRLPFRQLVSNKYENRKPVNGVTGTIANIPAWTLLGAGPHGEQVGPSAIKQFAHCGNATLAALVVNTPPAAAGQNAGVVRNAASAILQLRYAGNGTRPFYSAILPGDALQISEERARVVLEGSLGTPAQENFEVSLLLASHHGSVKNGSNSEEWADAIYPSHVLYSSGLSHGHPAEFIVQRYEQELEPRAVVTEHDISYGLHNATTLFKSHRHHYSTYSSGSIISTVFIPKPDKTDEEGEPLEPFHQIYTE